MNKIIMSLLTLFLILTLTACDVDISNPDYNPPTTSTEDPAGPPQEEHVELDLQIALADEELLSTFDHLHEVDYAIAHAPYLDAIPPSDVKLVIWTNVPLRNFALLTFANDVISEESIFIPIDTFGQVSELSPGEGFVVNSYFGMGTLPWSGVTFIDESGTTRYFAFIQNQGEQGDPFLIWEFENRTSELPPDWTPWWEGGNVLTVGEPTTSAPVVNIAHELSHSPFEEWVGEVVIDFYEFDYNIIRDARGEERMAIGDRLLIWSEVPIRNFSIIAIKNDIIDNELVYTPFASFSHIAQLPARHGIVINLYGGLGTLPWSGIRFEDENGNAHYFAIVQDQRDRYMPYLLLPFLPKQN